MRSLLLSATILFGSFGIVTATPGEAKAYWPVSASGYTHFGFGTMRVFGVPMVRWKLGSTGWSKSVYWPGGFMSANSPLGVSRLWYGPRTMTMTYNTTTGFSMSSTNRSVTGYVFSPYTGLRTVNVSGNTTASSLSTLLSEGYQFTNKGSLLSMGTWRGSPCPMLNIPMPGTGSSYSVPFVNWVAMRNVSLEVAINNAFNYSLLNLISHNISNWSGVYSDYVPWYYGK